VPNRAFQATISVAIAAQKRHLRRTVLPKKPLTDQGVGAGEGQIRGINWSLRRKDCRL
jgi:hypothetical protein